MYIFILYFYFTYRLELNDNEVDNMPKGKVLIIGFDGATFNLIKPMINELPNFKKIMKNGVYGNLKSTIPPISAPAWTSFMTGKNPGKHSIFYFNDFDLSKKEIGSLVDATKIDGERFWDIIGNHNKKVGIINITVTYPPKKVNGFMISGCLTPSKKIFTYPPELEDELEDYVIDVKISKIMSDSSFGKLDKKQFNRELRNVAKNRLKNTLKLMNKNWDLFIVMFRILDLAQHFFWDDKDFLKSQYKIADNILGKIMKKANKINKNTSVIVVSDHGFRSKTYKNVHLNDWLKRNGFLKTKGIIGGTIIKKWIAKVLQSLGLLDIAWKIIPKKMTRETFYEDKNIDWSKTKANLSPTSFAYSWIGIDINIKGRGKDGVVETGKEYENLRNELIEKLSKLRDIKTGKKVIEKIFRREEIYSGKYMDIASDLILKFKFPYKGEKSIGNSRLITESIKTNLTGEHEINGIFLAYGLEIKKGEEIKSAEIIDIAPTVLHMFGLEIPEDMDGKLLKIFKSDSGISKRKIKYKKVSKRDVEKEKIKETIKKLKILKKL